MCVALFCDAQFDAWFGSQLLCCVALLSYIGSMSNFILNVFIFAGFFVCMPLFPSNTMHLSFHRHITSVISRAGEKFDYTKEVIRTLKAKRNRQYNGQN